MRFIAPEFRVPAEATGDATMIACQTSRSGGRFRRQLLTLRVMARENYGVAVLHRHGSWALQSGRTALHIG